MKKILMSLFVLGLFAFSFQAHASVLSDALLKIENLTKELTQLKLQLKASVADSSTVVNSLSPKVTIIATPETIPDGGVATISWKSENTNDCDLVGMQEQGISGSYQTGRLGVDTSYTITCTASRMAGTVSDSVIVHIKKDPVPTIAPVEPSCPLNYPNPYALCKDGKIEPATKDANGCTTSYKCTNPVVPVAPIIPSVKVVSQNGGETYKTGDKITVKWSTSDNISKKANNIWISLNNSNDAFDLVKTQILNDGIENVIIPNNVPSGRYQVFVTVYGAYTTGDRGGVESASGFITIKPASPICPQYIKDPNYCKNGTVKETIDSVTGCPSYKCIETTTPKITVISKNESTKIKEGGESDSIIRFNVSHNQSESINVNSFKINFEYAGGDSTRLDNYIKDVRVYTASARAAILNVSDFVKEKTGVYSKTVGIPSDRNIVFPKGNREFYVTVTTNPSIADSISTSSKNWNIYINNIRYTLASGFVSADNSVVKSNFTIVSDNLKAPSITILSPNGGEVYKAGEKITVKWKTENYKGNIFEINLIPLDMKYGHGMTFDKQISNTGSYTFTLPAVADDNGYWSFGKNFKIEVIIFDSNNKEIKDLSDNLFTINSVASKTPSITVLSPNGGESYKAGDKITVKWKSNNIPASDRIQISLLDAVDNNVGDIQVGVITVSNDGEETFTLPAINWDGTNINGGKRYKLGLWTANGEGSPTYKDYSDNTFTINSSSLTKPSVTPTIDTLENTTPSITPIPTTRTLKVGVTEGDDVKALQTLLGIKADGKFGPATKAKVIEWQKANNLKPDGAFGNASRLKAGL